MRRWYLVVLGCFAVGGLVWLFRQSEARLDRCIAFSIRTTETSSAGVHNDEWTVRTILGDRRGRLDVRDDISYLLDLDTDRLKVLFHQTSVFWDVPHRSWEEGVPSDAPEVIRQARILANASLREPVEMRKEAGDHLRVFSIVQPALGARHRITVRAQPTNWLRADERMFRSLVEAAAGMSLFHRWIGGCFSWVRGIPHLIEAETTYGDGQHYGMGERDRRRTLKAHGSACPLPAEDVYAPPVDYRQEPVDLMVFLNFGNR